MVQPMQSFSSVPQQRKLHSAPAHPVIYMAEKDRPPLINIKEWDDPKWRANTVLVLDVPYYYERSIENGIDPAHNEFVHPSQGSPGLEQPPVRAVERPPDPPPGASFPAFPSNDLISVPAAS